MGYAPAPQGPGFQAPNQQMTYIPANALSAPQSAPAGAWNPGSSRPPARGPIFRAKIDDEPAPTLVSRPAPLPPANRILRIPAPEDLGVQAARLSASLDWAAVHARLDQLGATCFHLERLPEGSYRFTCLLPTSQRDRQHRIEASGADKADTIRLALSRAEAWAQAR